MQKYIVYILKTGQIILVKLNVNKKYWEAVKCES